MRAIVIALLAAACGSGDRGATATPSPQPPTPQPPAPRPPTTATSTDGPPTLSSPIGMTPALLPIAWLRGHWLDTEGGLEHHWVVAGGALYTVTFRPAAAFDVAIIDDASGAGPADGKLRVYAMPGGEPPFEMSAVVGPGRSLDMSLPGPRPLKITYRLDDDNLLHTSGSVGAAATATYAPSPSRVPALLDADRAFSAAVAKHGVAAWLAAFEPDGWMLSKGAKVKGAAIGAMMKPILDSGSLAWEPVGSGVKGDLGFTVGTATFTGKTPADGWRSSYVTIWAKQSDGSWKVRFDTGRPINE